MKIELVVPAALALFAAAYMLLGIHLSRIWGVDASRRTPARERGRGTYAPVLLLRDLLVFGAIALAIEEEAASIGFVDKGGAYGALAILGVLVCLGGFIGYGALFVSMRHEGRGVSHAANMEIGKAAEKLYHLLALGLTVCAAALPVGRLLAALGVQAICRTQQSVLFRCAMLLGMFALLPAARTAAQIRREDEAAPLAMGGALMIGLLVVFRFVGGVAALSASLGVETHAALFMQQLIFYAACLCAVLTLMRLAADAFAALIRRDRLRIKKPTAMERVLPFIAAGWMIAAVVFFAGEWSALVAAACGALLAVMTLIVSAVWFARIGRRMV